MNRKMSKRQKDIKSKLMAAIAMLLVSSIMMVSTTYAWFTLSTAPEVTGINTAVGANGNLEMALLPIYGNEHKTHSLADFGITTGTDDSLANGNAQEANITWGNLVDLSTSYGLENITLYPSEVNAVYKMNGTEKTTIPESIIRGSFLKTPKYGADGRIASMTSTLHGVYQDGQAQQEMAYTLPGSETNYNTANPAGVRLIGTVSNMTPQQSDFRNAISYASAAGTSGNTTARKALDDNGDALGQIAIKYALDGDTATFDDTDKGALVNVVTGLTNAVTQIEEAIRQYTYAYQISLDDEAYKNLTTTILGEGATKPALTSLTTYMPEAWHTGTGNMLAALDSAKTRISTATTELAKLTDGSYTWGEIKGAMEYLMNISKMDINGYPVMVEDESGKLVQNSELKGKIGGIVIKGEKVNLNMPSGSGAFADIADFTGNYNTSIDVPVSVVDPDLGDEKITAFMYVKAKNPTYLKDAEDDAKEHEISSDGAAQAISDYYGYVIDLAFRTNAADSYVKLQTEAVDRILTDGTTTKATQGGGATMVFESTDSTNGFTAARMTQLMKHIRIIFFDPESENQDVIAFGVLDQSHIQADGDYKVTAGLRLASTPTPKTDADYIANNKLVDLNQNEAKRVSVLVYLDGTTITNGDVAIGAAQSMRGKLNLQFSSSASLVPMEYSDFVEDAGNSGEEEEEDEPVISNVTTGTVTDGYAAVIKHVAVGNTYKLVAVITETTGNTAVESGVTVKIGDADATFGTVGNYSGWVVDGEATAPSTAVNVTVTANP